MNKSKSKSMLVDHPFWDRIKPKKGTIDQMSGLEITEIMVPNEKYFNFLEKLYGITSKVGTNKK